MNQTQQNFANMKAYISENLTEICSELLNWQITGVLSGDKLRNAAELFPDVSYSVALTKAESIAKTFAMQKIVNGDC